MGGCYKGQFTKVCLVPLSKHVFMINSRFKENCINKIYNFTKSLSPVGNSGVILLFACGRAGQRGGEFPNILSSSFPMKKYVFPYIEIKKLCTELQIDVQELCNSECVSHGEKLD